MPQSNNLIERMERKRVVESESERVRKSSNNTETLENQKTFNEQWDMARFNTVVNLKLY